MTTVYEDIIVEFDGPVGVLTINRPSSRNALRFNTLIELGEAVRECEAAAQVRALVVVGAGDRAFSSGADLKELKGRSSARRDRELVDGFANTFRRISSCGVPVIAAIRGYALGGGLELAMACHLRVAGEGALLGQPEILRGHIPGAGGTVRLPRLIGAGRALQYLLTGDNITAHEAERIGLVNWVVPDEDVVSFSRQVAKRMSKLSATALQLTLQAVVEGHDMPLEQALVFERSLCSRMRYAADYSEGLDAFAEKRAANYDRDRGEAT